MKDLTTTIFRGYRLLRCLGYGDFAAIYLGEHLHLKNLVAIKILQIQPPEEDLRSFYEEARYITHIRHPHIVAGYASGVENGMPFMVMDYAVNGTLRDRYPLGSCLSYREITRYVTQAADALQYIHDHERLVHCDVKPGNMLLGPEDQLWLSDFGAALAVPTPSFLLNRDEIAGTVEFMAPEQIQGEPCFASDQYSLGVVVYEWLCGSCPFTGSIAEIPMQHLYDEPPSLRAKIPTISLEIEQVVFRALEKQPEARFPSVRAFADALQKAFAPASYSTAIATASEAAIVALPVPEPAHLVVEMPTLPLPVPTQAQLKAASPALSLSAPIQAQYAKATPPLLLPAPTVEIIPIEEVHPLLRAGTASKDQDKSPPHPTSSGPLSSQRPTRLRTLPRRSAMVGLGILGLAVAGGGVALASTDKGLWANLYNPTANKHASEPLPKKRPVATRPETFLYLYRGHSQAVKGVAWLSDQYIASGSLDNTVHIWNASTGKNRLIYTDHNMGVKTIVSSPTERFIASGDGDGFLRIWNTTTGVDSRAPFFDGRPQAIRSLAWSPNARFLASGSDDSIVSVWDTLTGFLSFSYMGHSGSVLGLAWSPDGRLLASASDDQTVQVWNPYSRQQQALLTYRGHSQRVWSVAWSPDSRLLASASQDGTLQVWNAATGSLLVRHPVASGKAEAVAWSPNGRVIASGSDDGTVQLWGVASRRLAVSYHHQRGTIWSLAWSPNGRRLASASSDNTVLIW